MSARDFFDPKTIFINVSLQKSFLRYSRLLAAAIIILGLIPFIGWLLNSEYLTRLLPTLPQMRPTTSMQFIMIGSALLCLTYPRKRIVYLTKDLLAFLVALLGMVTLYEFRENKAIIVSQLVNPLLQVRLPDDFLIIPPTVSILFILSSLAILLVDTWKKRNFFQYLILLAGIVILPSIIEHFYGIDFIYGFALHTKMSLHVTIGMIFLSLGILFSRPSVGFMAVVSSETAGGHLARRMFITALALPIFIGGVVFLGSRAGWYETEFRFLLFVALIIIVFAYIIWRNARFIHLLDIERRNSEQSVYRLASIVESSDDAIIGRDLKGIITDWNRGAEELYGYTAEEVIGKPITFLFPKNAKEEFVKFNKKLKSGKSVRELEAVRLTKDGSTVPVSITASPIKNSFGKIVGVSTISRDITDRKQVERQRELFISIASHELKTPVTSTKAYTQLLQKHFEKRKDKESLSYLTKMDSQLNKLTELISYLLDVSTIQKGQLQLNLTRFDLDEVVNETIEELQRTTVTHTIVKDGRISKKVTADRSRITQVLRNILTNAIKYSPHADKVIVSCATHKEYITISITDFGIGIPKSEQRKVFDPLYRSTGAKKDNYTGLGLGLFITKEIIKKHGGSLRLLSTEGKGTVITVQLPLHSHKAAKK